MSKLIVIIGITGNQGGSVANVFLKDPEWRIRGLTRDSSSAASQQLASRGIEVVRADLHDPSTLAPAFKGANLIFSVTDFWKPFFNPANVERAAREGISIGQLCYNLEYEQGKNIADAAAHPNVLATLDETGLIASTLSNARECSKGKYTELYHFDAKADVFPKYVEKQHLELAKKTSYLQTGMFMSSWHYMPQRWPGKQADGSFVARMATAADSVLPHLDVNSDTGYYVKALAQLPAGKTAMAAGQWSSWGGWMEGWARGMETDPARVGYEQVSVEEMSEGMGAFGKEVAEMFEYSSWPGYDGGLPILKGRDLREMGFDIPLTTVEEYTRKEDWTAAMNV
ncbi:uncharacterized protein LTR77_004567 [Saxophila tyrrhenica]|uniref:NmrA-like domain-containing protein n=1 Tax=Saxophila tyrrhenica TaxID=1690608 RepID=A0AAV9PE98_9PEZI|nr:hypothetical protein LTR77_004567 [Saxophila tyrrhenica]